MQKNNWQAQLKVLTTMKGHGSFQKKVVTIKGIITAINMIIPLPIKPTFLYTPFSANSANINPIVEAITPTKRKLSLPNRISM